MDPAKVNTLTVSDSDGRTYHYHRPDERECDRRTRRLRRKLHQQRNAALADGRARWTSRRNRRGQVKRRFRWNGAPARSYLRTLRQLQAVERRRSGQRSDWSRRVSAELTQKYAVICWEDTQIRNLTRSAQRTVEQPGRNVARKRGLNRGILAQGWGQLRSLTEYKTTWAGRIFVPAPARNTSITCPERREANAESHPAQPVFRRVNCGYTGNADGNAAEITRGQGLTLSGRADVCLSSPEDETSARAAADAARAAPCAGDPDEIGVKTAKGTEGPPQPPAVPAGPRDEPERRVSKPSRIWVGTMRLINDN